METWPNQNWLSCPKSILWLLREFKEWDSFSFPIVGKRELPFFYLLPIVFEYIDQIIQLILLRPNFKKGS